MPQHVTDESPTPVSPGVSVVATTPMLTPRAAAGTWVQERSQAAPHRPASDPGLSIAPRSGETLVAPPAPWAPRTVTPGLGVPPSPRRAAPVSTTP